MIARFAAGAADLVTALFPRYAPYVKRARTSYRPQPAVGPRRLVAQGRLAAARRRLSVAAQSRRAHPARVLERQSGRRIASGASASRSRRWRRRCCRGSRPVPGAAALLAALRVTKGRRSRYDHLMLGLHDRAKADLAYQRDCTQETVHFAPGHDVALLLRPGDARRASRASSCSSRRFTCRCGAVRSGALAARHPGAPHRPRPGAGALTDAVSPCAPGLAGRAPGRYARRCPRSRTTYSFARCAASPRRTRRSG